MLSDVLSDVLEPTSVCVIADDNGVSVTSDDLGIKVPQTLSFEWTSLSMYNNATGANTPN